MSNIRLKYGIGFDKDTVKQIVFKSIGYNLLHFKVVPTESSCKIKITILEKVDIRFHFRVSYQMEQDFHVHTSIFHIFHLGGFVKHSVA